MRRVSLLLALLGLAGLHLAVLSRDAPRIRATEVSGMMQYAFVRVDGSVRRDAYESRYRGRTSYMSFPVHDGSGEIRVAAYGDVARALREQKRIPKRGDRVVVRGTLDFSTYRQPRIVLRAVDDLCLTRGKKRARKTARKTRDG
jgi:hypothetical protein